ncbi:DNA polymerase Y family protein [Sphingobium sp. BYY-5]|uniref:Y-family DNA polymerase n=1 Tax=Sphingobium sp. BYY-5 TaxID=2926400 RepID=UPI001FA7B369|nr:DNA polymerase Y family protein [Sphingobium sp. BYY-5]MCI4591320.1 DNA polymerase Y family protein [Sphingobium sp. BYY-5]
MTRNSDIAVETRRYLALSFPFLPIDRLRIRRPDLWAAGANGGDGPAIVVEPVRGAMRLAAVDADGLTIGLTPGMTLADARAREPELRVFDADPHADQDWLERLCDGCARYTPNAAPDGADGLMLDISGCGHLWGGEEALAAEAAARLERHGLRVRHAIAASPEAAHALARFPVPPAPDEEAAVRRLPVEALGLEEESAVALRRAGLRIVGDLAALPAATLAARFGEEAVDALHALLGLGHRPLRPRRPRPAVRIDRRFAEPLGSTAYALKILEEMAAEAGERLAERGEGGRRFEAVFFRSDGLAFPLRVETSLPVRDAPAILRLMRERIDALSDPIDPGFGFDMLRLTVSQAERLAPTQLALEGGEARREDSVAALVDRLSIRAGRARIQRLEPRDSHIPEQAQLALPAVESRTPGNWENAGEPDDPPMRPLHLFDPPQPIEVVAQVPDGPPHRFRWRRALHDITRFEGPERIAPEWWRAKDGGLEGESVGRTRDYYRVEDARGRRYWIFRHGLYGAEAAHPGWYIHGLFA